MRKYLKQACVWGLALAMVLPGPAELFAQTQTTKPKPLNYDNEDLNHRRRLNDDKLPVLPARPAKDQSSKDYVNDPAQPAIYTLRTDYKAEKGEKYSVNYQPYVASVGANASDAEQTKVNKKIDLPNMAGYKMPEGETSFTNSYDAIVNAAKYGHKTGDAENGFKYLALAEKKYKAKENTIVVKHVFQDMDDFTEFSNPDETITKTEGTQGKIIRKVTKTVNGKQVKEFDYKNPETVDLTNPDVKEAFFKHEDLTSLRGNTGSTLEVQALPESQRKGFEPQIDKLKTQVPEDTSDFKIEYRYNRAAYDVVFDTKEGTPLPTRTYYFNQEIPKLDTIPTKIGCEFLGWKPSHDLEGIDGEKYKKGDIITDANGNAIVDLGNTFYKKDGSGNFEMQNGDPVKGTNKNEIKLKMPALKLGDGKSIPREKLTFTAVWKDKKKADYAIQFWVEKADHPDGVSLLNKYDYMGTRVYNQEATGTRPDLDTVPLGPNKKKPETKNLSKIKLPDLDDGRLAKIYNEERFNRGKNLELDKYFVYNKKLTDEQNKDPKTNVTKTVSATGKTVYNIYYDRQVYDLYFTKSNALSNKETFYPEIWGYDQEKGTQVKLGGPGKPYHYKARFNELMYKWPNDAMQTKGFTPGWQSYGWGGNYSTPSWPWHLDTPPYRLNASQFLDATLPGNKNYDAYGGYVNNIDAGNGVTIPAKDFRTLSFGIKQQNASIPHHMDFWMDGFKPGETIIRYDLVRTKADTADPQYTHKYPIVEGFTPYAPFITEETQEDGRVTEDRIGDLNDEREEITPNDSGLHYNIFGFKVRVGELKFIPAFFSDSDEFGDPLAGEESGFKQNGYLQFHYKRNKYPLRFNTDPTKIKDDSAFDKTNQLETFYRFPLIALNPELDKNTKGEDKEYFKDHPANFLDQPNNLFKLGLTDLLQRDKDNPNNFAKDAKGNYRVKRPEGLSDQLVFKGWAMDPAGKKMVWENDGEKMPSHPVNLYAVWDEPDYKWKVTFDPNGGKLDPISVANLTTEKKTINEKEGDSDKPKPKTYPVAGYKGKDLPTGEKNKPQVFTVVQRQKLNNLPKPERYGYDFLGWEVIRYKKDASDQYTDEQDKSYRERYNVPELYSFGTDVVSPIYLKAIWVENKRAEVQVRHYYLKNVKTDNGEKLVLDTSKYPNPEPNSLDYKRVGDYVPATGEKQDEHWILATNAELMGKLHGTYQEEIKDATGKVTGKEEHELLPEYEAYNNRVKLNNTFFQSFIVQPDKKDEATGQITPNPENIFRFYYRPFRTRNYKVNYIDERGKAEIDAFFKGLELKDITGLTDDALLEANTENKAKFKAKRGELEKILDNYKVIDKEDVTSGCRHYDARNYRHIPGWTLASSAQQQLFYDVNENTNEFLGINGTGSNEIYFYYKDARVIEVKNPKDKTPEGYVRVTFKIDDKHKGGVFEDKDGNKVTELHYDVIKGLKSDLLPKPIILKDGEKKEENRYYITPDQGKSFKEWNNAKWLNAQTEINKDYTFTAYFDWSGMSTSSKGLVRTEAYTDPKGKWTNDFAPKLSDLKAQLVWKGKNEDKTIPEGTDIKFVYKDDAGKETELTKDEDIYNLVKELNEKDAKQTVRVLNIVAKVTFKDGKQTQELPIPITVYKNRYEALNEKGDKPIYLSNAEKKEAKDGGLKDILKDNTENRYIKVTIKPNKDFDNKDNKVYYVNPNAWVEIPKVESTGDSRFTNWTADIADYNEESKENGVFDFAKRHKFTKDTVITPVGAKDIVEQEKGKDKPDVPKTYVKVIVKTTDKATDETAFERTFWVNPKADVTIDVTNPTGKTVAADTTKPGTVGYTMTFFKWQTEDKSKAWEGKIAGKFEKDTTILAQYSVEFEKIKDLTPKTDTVPTPQGKTPTVDEITKMITPPEGKTIKEVKIVKNPDVSKPGDSKVQVIVEYDDGSSAGTETNPIEIPVKVHDPIVKANPDGSKPKDAMADYVKVTFTAGTGGTVSGDLVYYVSPEVEVNMTDSAKAVTKTPNVGYYVNGEKWTPEIKAEKITEEKTYVFNFDKSKDVVEKIDENTKIPEGYVTVTFKTEDANKGKVAGDKLEKVYYVNPKAGITLKVLGKGETATDKQLAVPTYTANTNYTFLAWQEPIDESTPITSDRIHVATFQYGKFTLTYDKGGEDVTGDVPADVTVNYGETVGLADKGTLKKPNHEFAGWKLDNDETIYQPGAQVKLEKARTATAQWKPVNHTVTFDAKGGSKVDSQQVKHGKTATEPSTKPTLDGKVFMGWKEQGKENEEAYFNFNTPIEADKTLIAIWQDSVQKIDENATVEGEFIKVTFKQGDHGTLKGETVFKVAKDYTFDQAKAAGLVVPEIAPAKYYKAKADNNGWDKELNLTIEANQTEKVFTAQYEPKADVIPVDPQVTDDQQIKKEKPDGMVLVTFKVDPEKAFMLGATKFYVKKDQVVNIEKPLVRRLELANGKPNNYVFKGWDLTQLNNEWKFTKDTTIDDGSKVKPTITIILPSAGDPEVSVESMTEGATAYLEVSRKGKTPVTIEAVKDEEYNVYYFIIPDDLGEKLNKRDKIKVYAELDGLRSETREYRVK